MRIFMKGFYGFSNIGDDLFVNIGSWISNEKLKSHPIYVGKNLPLINTKAKKIKVNNHALKQFIELFECFFICDKILIFGGSTINGVGSKNKLSYWFNKYRSLEKKLGTIGTSVSLRQNQKQDDLAYMRKFRFLGVRDERSYIELKSNNVSENLFYSFDPVVIVKDVFPSLCNVQKETSTLGVSICVNRKDKNISDVDLFVEFLKTVIRNGEFSHIKLFEFNGNGEDFNQAKRIYDSCKSNDIICEIVRYTSDTESFCKEFAKCSFVIGSRLHSGILAYSLGIPFMLEEYHQKCSDFLTAINHNYRFDQNDLDASMSNFKSILQNGSVPDLVDIESMKHKFYTTVDEYNKSLFMHRKRKIFQIPR